MVSLGCETPIIHSKPGRKTWRLELKLQVYKHKASGRRPGNGRDQESKDEDAAWERQG